MIRLTTDPTTTKLNVLKSAALRANDSAAERADFAYRSAAAEVAAARALGLA